MPKATLLLDCKTLADTVASVGGRVPDALGNLLAAHALLSSAGSSQAGERDILTHALDGTLDAKTLDRLVVAAAAAQQQTDYRLDLARRSEHVLVGEWHRQLEAGAANQILDSVRGRFDKAAAAIMHARSIIPMESSPEHILETAGEGALEAWRTLDEYLRIVDVIGTRIAAQFGCRLGNFPQIAEVALADGFKLEDRAIFATDGDLEVDSSLFRKPGAHRNSPWCRTALKLHTVESATARYQTWAAIEWDRLHSGQPESWIDEQGNAHQKPKPRNPFRQKASAT